MNKQEIITVGLDIGYAQTKAFASNGRKVCFESRVAPAEFIRFQADHEFPAVFPGQGAVVLIL